MKFVVNPAPYKIFEDYSFIDDEKDCIYPKKLSYTIFIRLSIKGQKAKKIILRDIDFSYSYFENCYIRNCLFINCNLTGCKFIATNLKDSAFQDCNFQYVTFEKTYIDGDILDVANFPYSDSQNLQRLFARTIKINCISIGDHELVKKAIDYEINATEIYKKNKFKSHSNYYRTKYQNDKLKNQIKYRCEFYWFRFVQGYICGHFERWDNPFKSMILVIVFCTLWICFLQNDICHFYRYFKEIIYVFFGVQSSQIIPADMQLVLVIIKWFFLAIIMTCVTRRMSFFRN